MQQMSINKLSAARRGKAVNYIKAQGRPLERALYAYHFEGGSAAAVMDELRSFQNKDSGFGHALEPDLRLNDSSVIATTVALQRMLEIHALSDHPLVESACKYLRDTYNASTANWPIMPPNVDDAPHAPWWEYGGDLSRSLVNPRAEILGYLYQYPEHFPEAMRQQVTDSVMAHFLATSDEIEMNDLHCYLRLYETPALPASIKNQLFGKLQRAIDRTVARDPQQWHSYVLQPLGAASRPDSPFAPMLSREIDANLNFVIDQQSAEGYWEPNWSWFDLYPEHWPTAQRDWRGFLTLNTLCQLKAFDRLG
jgi:hypothetical protein